jgi:hypothetical protein
VTKALEILREEVDIAMALTGITDASKVPRSVILKGVPDEIAFRQGEPRGTKRLPRVFEQQH